MSSLDCEGAWLSHHYMLHACEQASYGIAGLSKIRVRFYSSPYAFHSLGHTLCESLCRYEVAMSAKEHTYEFVL